MEKLPAQMTVVAISKPGGPEVLIPEQRALPVPGAGELLVKVMAAGVNRPDVAQRSGAYPPPPGASDLPGLEIAGEVVATGSGVSRHKVGDKVMSLVAGGGYAEYCITHETHAMSVPKGLSMTDAGAIAETLMTVWHNVFERGGLKPGETLLIHGGSSGIGTSLHLAMELFMQAAGIRMTHVPFNGGGPAWETDNLYRLYTKVERGFIRVDADELTYPAHIILRYEIERALMEGDIEVADIPDFNRELVAALVQSS